MADETKVPIAVEIRQKSKEALEGSGDEIKQRIVDQLVEDEKGRRVDVLSDAFSAREALARDLSKLRNKPDQVLHPIGGGDVVKYHNDDTVKTVKSKQEKLDNLDAAIETAMTSSTGESYDKLTKATNKAKE